MLSRNDAIAQMDAFGATGTPFFFFTDFKGSRAWVKAIADIDPGELMFAFHEPVVRPHQDRFTFEKHPLPFEAFRKAFDQVVHQIHIGNSFLVNLTFKTPVTTDLSLDDIFRISRAKYKLRFRDQFVVFSPETFIRIHEGQIYSYPMKGTLDASIDNAQVKLLNDPKEMAEHVTIVDLIRNDLSQIADDVEVARFRFITEVQTHEKKLLQVSSEIRGEVQPYYLNRPGSLIFSLLPAGSISGAPKAETVRIIEEAEDYQRGFYTGVCGVFDGKSMDSGVMIRFIEKEGDQLYYKSGGGITSFSSAEKEYREIIDKIYIPKDPADSDSL